MRLQSVCLCLGVLGLTSVVGCSSKRQQVERCAYIADARGLGPCLVEKYGWSVSDALAKELDYRSIVNHLSDSMAQAGAVADARARRVGDSVRRLPSPPTGYEPIRREGNTIIAYINKQFAADSYRVAQFGGNLCERRTTCTVSFVTSKVDRIEVASYHRPGNKVVIR